jgi:N-acetyl-1-D-myo-inositol-2-amino-2-deoxy-alpha-D-glucopyranoside deacetylase
VVDVLPVGGKVRAAIEQYRSQVTVDAPDPADPSALSYVMPHGVRHRVPAQEGFRHDAPPVPTAPETFAEMSGPGKATAVVVAAVVGLLVGGLGTITHQQTVAIGAWSAVPVGMVLTTLIVIGVVVGVRLLYRSRLLVAAVGVGTILATQVLVAVAGQTSPLVLANAAGYVWTFGPALVAMFVLAWPDLTGLRVQRTAEASRSEVAAPHR